MREIIEQELVKGRTVGLLCANPNLVQNFLLIAGTTSRKRPILTQNVCVITHSG